MDSFTSPKNVQRTNVSNFGESLNWENSSQPARRRDNKGRYSLPGNFETTYLSAGNGKNNHGIAFGGHHANSNRQRPVSAYSDRNVVYGHQNDWWSGNDIGSGREPVTNHHMYSQHQRPLSVMSDNHLLYGASNGYPGPEMPHHQQSSNQTPLSIMSDNQHLYAGTNGYYSGQHPGTNGYYSGQHPEALQRPWNQEQLSPYTDYRQSYTNTSENMDKHIGQAEMPQKTTDSSLKTSHSNTFSRPSVNDNSPQSGTSQNSILKQREFLALEQKRLEDHYAALQGQLLADFQKRQQDLIKVYNKSLETQSSTDHTMQSILERSFEYDSEETLVSNTTDKEHFTLNRTEELPQSPFAINVKRNSFQNGENNSRSIQNSAERMKQGSDAFSNPGLPNEKARNNARFLQNSASPASLLQNSQSDARFMKNSSPAQSYVSPDQRFPKSSSVPQNSVTHDQRFISTSFRNSALPDARKSFNSEASAQEYYEMPGFGENTKIVGNKLDPGSTKNGGVGKTGRNSMKNFGVVTSPKRTRLNSFESQVRACLSNLVTLIKVSVSTVGILHW